MQWPLSVIDSHSDKVIGPHIFTIFYCYPFMSAKNILVLSLQVLCVDWWKGDSVVSGGADSKMCIASGISVK